MRYTTRYILMALIGAILAVFLIWPIVRAIGQGFYYQDHFTFYWLMDVFRDVSTREWLINAGWVAVTTTALTVILALPLAMLADRVNFRGKAIASALLLVPMILPPFVGAIGFKQLFSLRLGAVNLIFAHLGLPQVDFLASGFWAVVVLETLHLYPIMYLNAVAALANIDPAMAEAGRNLGASRWEVFRRITLPLMRPGLFAGATIVFIWSFCELGTPLMLNYVQVLPVKIFEGLNDLNPSANTRTFAMVFVMLSSSVGLYALGRVLFGQAGGAMAGRASIAAVTNRAGWLTSLGCWAVFGLVTFLAVMPHIGVILLSVAERWDDTILPAQYTARHLVEVFHRSETWDSILNSLRYASISTVACAVLGMLIAYLVVRLRVRGASLLDSVSMLPLAVPGLVMAAGYVAITLPNSFLESIGPTKDPTLLLIIAYTIRRLPYMVRSVSAGLQQTSETLEEAAQNLGASRPRAVMKITVPLVMANILAGGILAFSFNMLEVSDSLILAQTSDYYPITKQLYVLSGVGTTVNLAAALGVYGMILLAGTLLITNVLLGKRMGQLFRV